MHRIPDTQREAYEDLKPKLNVKQMVVYIAICEQPSTLFELERRLEWPINCISGRVTELHDKHELIEPVTVGDKTLKRQNPRSGKWGIVWGKRTAPKNQPDLLEGVWP